MPDLAAYDSAAQALSPTVSVTAPTTTGHDFGTALSNKLHVSYNVVFTVSGDANQRSVIAEAGA